MDSDQHAEHRDHDHHDEKKKHEELPGRAIVARFETGAEAREAIAALHKAHFKKTWLGSTSVAQTTGGQEAITVESSGFFSGTQSLTEALVSHGVLGDTARDLELEVEPGNAIVTVDPGDGDRDEALAILRLTAASVTPPTPVALGAISTPRGTVVRSGADFEATHDETIFERR